MYMKLITLFFLLHTCYVTEVLSKDNRIKLNQLIEELIVSNYGENGIISRSGFAEFVSRVVPNVEVVKKGTSNKELIATVYEIPDSVAECLDNLTAPSCRFLIAHKCFDRKTIFNLFATESTLNASTVSLTFPALLHNLVTNACTIEDHHVYMESRDHHQPLSSVKSWGYGIGAVAVICFISNIGGLMAPCMKSEFFQRILMYFVALAAGTLGSTGAMILIPESLGLKSKASLVPLYNWKLATVLGGVYSFYLLERILKLFLHRKKGKAKVVNVSPAPANGKHDHFHFPPETPEDCVPFTKDIPGESPTEDTKEQSEKPVKQRRQVAPVAWLMLIGDALHNFVDGISIGAAFTENVYIGLSVTIAIICEELPHELGDIAILLHAGMSMKRALLLNFLAALTAAIGLVLGILLGENTDANTWIFAGAGGMFLYISLVDMVPEMSEQAMKSVEAGDHPLSILIIQNLGLLSGFTIICLLANLGGNISV